jgi:hypothetical protein
VKTTITYEFACKALMSIGSEQRIVRLAEILFDEGGDEAFTDEQFWRLVADVWIATEGQSRYANERGFWEALWGANRPGREHAMTVWDRQTLAAMSDPIAIYRGVADCWGKGKRSHLRAFSWTTNRDKAAWFARRFTSATLSDGWARQRSPSQQSGRT